MRRLFLVVVTLCLLLSCSEKPSVELLDVQPAVTIVASVDDFTRVAVDIDEQAKHSTLSWQVGDHLTVVHKGRQYAYVATTAGRRSEFIPEDSNNALTSIDELEPIAAFYNVTTVDVATMRAKFDIPSVQREGEASNSIPLYGYSRHAQVSAQQLDITMRPLASLVELNVGSSRSWCGDKLAMSCSENQSDTYAVATGVEIDASMGEILLENATLCRDVAVEFAAQHDFSEPKRVQIVVMGKSAEKERLFSPIYHGRAVVKIYKNGRENIRGTIWRSYSPSGEAVDEHKHIRQPISNILTCKVADGISTAEQMKAFADTVNSSPEGASAGAEFSNEDGVVVLKNSIDLTAYQAWETVGSGNSGFVGVFDGGGNSITYSAHHSANNPHSTGLFGVVLGGGVVRNLNVAGTIVEDMTHSAGHRSAVGSVVTELRAGTVENCHSSVTITAQQGSDGRCSVGGVVGIVAADGAARVAGCTNSGDIDLSYPQESGSEYIAVGGVVASTSGFDGEVEVANCSNSGDIAVGRLEYIAEEVCVGGIVGVVRHKSTFEGCQNGGNIYIDAKNTAATVYGGGVVGVAGQESYGVDSGVVFDGCINGGTLFLHGGEGEDGRLYGGGIAAHSFGGNDIEAAGTYGALIADCKNRGVVRLLSGSRFFAGGIVGGCRGTAVTGSENSGVVAIECQAPKSEYLGGVVGYLENSYSIIDSCTNSGTVCALQKTAFECGETENFVYIMLGGIVGYGGGDKPLITRCTSRGNILAAHDGTLQYDAAAGSWRADNSVTTEFRGAIAGNLSANQRVENCTVGGAVGTAKGGSGAERYEAAIQHPLNNNPSDDYYYYRWLHGYKNVPIYLNISFFE